MSLLAEIQREVVTRLRSSAAVTALVPVNAISDGTSQQFPAITLGQDQTVGTDTYANRPAFAIFDHYLTIQVFTQSPGFITCKEIVSAVSAALRGDITPSGYQGRLCCYHDETRFLRDPDGKTQHAVLTFRIPSMCEA